MRLETIAVAYGSDAGTCPLRALRAWLAAAGRVDGPLFVGLTPQGGLRETALGDRVIAHVVKRRCKAVGIDPDKIAGHIPRRGFATAAARAKKPDRVIKRHGRWKSNAMLDRFIEDKIALGRQRDNRSRPLKDVEAAWSKGTPPRRERRQFSILSHVNQKRSSSILSSAASGPLQYDQRSVFV